MAQITVEASSSNPIH